MRRLKVRMVNKEMGAAWLSRKKGVGWAFRDVVGCVLDAHDAVGFRTDDCSRGVDVGGRA